MKNLFPVQKEDRKNAVLHSLSEFFGPEARDCIEYVEKDWHEEPYNGGCPVSVGTPGIMEFIGSALQDPFQRLAPTAVDWKFLVVLF